MSVLCNIVHRVVFCKPPLCLWQSWYFLTSNKRRLIWFHLILFHGLCHSYIANGNWTVFFCPWPWKMQGNWENWRNFFGWSAYREKNWGKMTKRVVKIQKFSQENVEIFLVVREPRQNLSSVPQVGKGWEQLGYGIVHVLMFLGFCFLE